MKKNILILLSLLLLISSFGYTANNSGNLTAKKESGENISRGEARLTLLKSLVVPGWGQHSLGYSTRGYIFEGTELLGWITFAALSVYGQSRKQDMRAYAAQYAGVETEGKSAAYYDDIKHYDNIQNYNEHILRTYGRQQEIAQSLYETDGKMDWDWENEEKRDKYSQIHYESRIAKRNATLAATALVINRIISALDVMGLTGGQVDEDNMNARASFQPGYYQQTISLQINF